MRKILSVILLLLPISALAEVDYETEPGWQAFQRVCLEQVGDVKEAMISIPKLAQELTGGTKITDVAYRKEQLIPDGDDAWSYNDGVRWYMIITDYGSCAVRVPGKFKGADEALSAMGYSRFGSVSSKWTEHEFYYSIDPGAPVVNLIHAVRNGEARLALIAINRQAYQIAVEKHPEDNPPLPDSD
ncbi:hypothetical protein [Aestuariispira insulae]|uniref:Uncharacterized protein n=1 Tax=Aestuariispira insulae TaxID=1461337 RepID=A0A3D9HS60_9PROT|nr:hypothetical protein [Aestuariispira insulae]RED52171.1 hypothetical protein DFP90_102189 [Aestuariispira insulae]